MESRGFTVSAATSVAEGLSAIAVAPPAFAVIDLRLSDGNGLDIMSELKARRPDYARDHPDRLRQHCHCVTAVKLGAFDYIAKPADADEIYNALMATQHDKAALPENPMSADRVRWEHIQRIYELCGRNARKPRGVSTCTGELCSAFSAKRAPR